MKPVSIVRAALAAAGLLATALPAFAEPPAKELFGAQHTAAAMPSQSVGFYSRGCLAGGVQLPEDGPNWQAMRLSRDRRYGHPQLVAFLERLSREAAERRIWPGLLVGDMSMARGGPMPSGHASHQIGLDADIWFQPMPNPRLTREARETFPFRSVLREGTFEVDDRIWNDRYRDLIKLAAEDPQVQRVFVHPGVKKKLCETSGRDRAYLNKVRPIYGHNEHFHVRLYCQPGSVGCEDQPSTGTGDGCGDLGWWFNVALQPPKPGAKPFKPKPPLTMAALPKACRTVLAAAGRGAGEPMVAAAPPARETGVPATASSYSGATPGGFAPMPRADVPLPRERPLR
ncbi:penicillin-insensitive murein endopeptidase [Aurantimonas sp. Leaf443]|uniref:penicillin-insensitive murein endopeptidase n=1 Tax=Aurantimonas sp. Leaf443 TaxID=1736378 RepID=UPI0009E7BD51|nr:penicillin-insensitive murein endopeptidase [Aurantimonas sp. Leaf443]